MPGSYYSVALAARWKLIVLDTTEMSLHSGYPEVGAAAVGQHTYSYRSYIYSYSSYYSSFGYLLVCQLVQPSELRSRSCLCGGACLCVCRAYTQLKGALLMISRPLLLLLLLQDSSQMQQAFQWLEAHPKEQHPNAETWNGGLSSAQMTWLQLELAQAAMAGEYFS
jgi:hypothetical protein